MLFLSRLRGGEQTLDAAFGVLVFLSRLRGGERFDTRMNSSLAF